MWVIQAQPHVMIRIKRLFPRVVGRRRGCVTVADTLDVARDLRWIHDRYPLEMSPETRAALQARLRVWTERKHAIDSILTGHPGVALFTEPARPPRAYQVEFAALMRACRRLLLGDEVGLGKTFSSLLTLTEPDALPALVVTLTGLPAQWLRELADTLPGLKGYAVTQGTPYDLRRPNRGHYPDVIVMNYAKLAGWSHALAGQVRTVIFDEVQELRHGTTTSKGAGAAHVSAQATYVCGLSASPVYNYGGEIWNIYDILSPGSLGTKSEFISEWGGSASNGKTTVADPTALGTYLRDNGLLLRRTRKDVHREIPEPIRIRQEISADHVAINDLGGDVLQMARLVLDSSAKGRDRWSAAGELDWRLRQATGVAKAPYVAEWVRLLLESEEKILLFGWHRAVYEIWLARLAEFHPVLYTGSETPTQKLASLTAFATGPARVLMMSLRSGAGLDGLQNACSVAVFGELDWSPEVHKQCVGRLARDGQQATVVAYFLVAGEGSDPIVEEVLGLKRRQAQPLLDPDTPLLEPITPGVDRVRLLAQAVLDRASRGQVSA